MKKTLIKELFYLMLRFAKKAFGGAWGKGFESRINKRGGLESIDFDNQYPGRADTEWMEKRDGLDYLKHRMGKRLGMARFGKRMGIMRMGKRPSIPWHHGGKRLGIMRMGKRMGIPWHHISSEEQELPNEQREWDTFPLGIGKRNARLTKRTPYRIIKRTPYRMIKRAPYRMIKRQFYPFNPNFIPLFGR